MVDDKAADLTLKEYKLIELNEKINNYSYEHFGTGFTVYNRCTESLYKIKLESESTDSDRKIAKCSCSSFLMYNLPCRHLFFVMKSVIDLNPFIQNRWLKYNQIQKQNSDCYEPIETQYESFEPNLFNQLGKYSQAQLSSKLLDETQKYNKLKPILDEISKLLCWSGQKEFDQNFNFYNKQLELLRLNKRHISSTQAKNSSAIEKEKSDETDSENFDLDDEHDRQNEMNNYEKESESAEEEENVNDNEIIEFGDEQFVERVEEVEEPNNDYIDHHITAENRRDGDPNSQSAPFFVTATKNRRGRGKGAAAPFGFFAARGNSQVSNVLNSPSTWPKKGPGSRGGKGKNFY
jgi:hypothetical protein